jgi:hypothetical protein
MAMPAFVDSRTDPHDAEGEELRVTAIEAAVMRGHANLLPVLKPDPTRDDFEDPYTWAPDARTVEALATTARPTKAGPGVAHHLILLDARSPGAADQALFMCGARWNATTPEEKDDWYRSACETWPHRMRFGHPLPPAADCGS